MNTRLTQSYVFNRFNTASCFHDLLLAVRKSWNNLKLKTRSSKLHLQSQNLFEDKTPDFSRGITEGVLEDLPERVSVSRLRRQDRNHRQYAGGRSFYRATSNELPLVGRGLVCFKREKKPRNEARGVSLVFSDGFDDGVLTFESVSNG